MAFVKNYLQPDWKKITIPNGFSYKQTEEAVRTVKMVPCAVTPGIYSKWVQVGGQGLCNNMGKSPAFEMKGLSSWFSQFYYCVNEFPNFVITSILLFVQPHHSLSIYPLWSSSVVQAHGSWMEARCSFCGNLGNVLHLFLYLWKFCSNLMLCCVLCREWSLPLAECISAGGGGLLVIKLMLHFDEDCWKSHFDDKTSQYIHMLCIMCQSNGSCWCVTARGTFCFLSLGISIIYMALFWTLHGTLSLYIQGVTGGTDQTSGGCSLC
jgi:hypothetical protein